MKRWLRHLCGPSAPRLFPAATLERITQAIAAGETTHGGQLVFAVEESLGLGGLWQGDTSRQCAERAFSLLRVWDTPGNSGVLLYLLLADHAIEVIADRAYDGQVHAAQWQACCDRLRGQVAGGRSLAEAVEDCIGDLSALMANVLPVSAETDRGPGLPDHPRFL